MDNRVVEIWKEKIWKPYARNTQNSALLLNQMESHIHQNFIDSVQVLRTRVINIPGGFISVSQPRDIGIMKPLKTRLIEECREWKAVENTRLGGAGKIPIPVRKKVLEWLNEVWKTFSSQIVNSFRKCGFTTDVDVDIDVALDFI